MWSSSAAVFALCEYVCVCVCVSADTGLWSGSGMNVLSRGGQSLAGRWFNDIMR